MEERVRATSGERLMNAQAEKRRYPLRAIRYWWAHNALLDESAVRPDGWVIVDVGCSSGILKRFAGDIPGSRWIGLDWTIQEEALRNAGYSGWHVCDFDRELPLPDASADVVIFLHVIEHLPRPDVALREIGRILKPGGILLAGSPVAPCWAARIREFQLRCEFARGERTAGRHCNSMDCRRWNDLIAVGGMETTVMSGAFFARWSANPLENTAWWLRLNLVWGALFPALGGEVYLAARKTGPVPAGVSASVARPRTLVPALRPLWAGVAVALMLLGVWAAREVEGCNCPISVELETLQDGNNRFHTLPHAETEAAVKGGSLIEVKDRRALDDVVEDAVADGADPFLVVPEAEQRDVHDLATGLGMSEQHNLEAGGVRFVVYGKAASPNP